MGVISIPKGVCMPPEFFENLGLKVNPHFVVPPTTVGVSTSVGGPRSFHQFERRSNSPMHSIVFEGIKEAAQSDSHENFLANLRDQSLMCSHKGENHIQCVRQHAAET